MADLGDKALLEQFGRENSEAAFAALVARHVNLVYLSRAAADGRRQACRAANTVEGVNAPARWRGGQSSARRRTPWGVRTVKKMRECSVGHGPARTEGDRPRPAGAGWRVPRKSSKVLVCAMAVSSSAASPVNKFQAQVFPLIFASPPDAVAGALGAIAESVVIDFRADVSWWGVGEGIGFEQAEGPRVCLPAIAGRILQTNGSVSRCRVFGKPHLPVQPWLVRGDETRTTLWVTRLVFEPIRQPSLFRRCCLPRFRSPPGRLL